MLVFTNNASSTLKVGALATDVQIALADGTGARFPNPGVGDSFFVTLVDTAGNLEIVEATKRVGDVLTVVRARDNTTAKSFPAGSVVDHRPVAEVFRRMSPQSIMGQANGIATLDAAGKLPTTQLPTGTLTQTDADNRYIKADTGNKANGFAKLDATGKLATTLLPAGLLTTESGDTKYILANKVGAASGVAALDANGKVPATQLPASSVDLNGLAPKANPVFSDSITVGGKATMNEMTVVGAASMAAVTATSLTTTETVTIKGGSPRGKLTLSTQPPSGTPAEGDEWVQHEA